jgi:hypothetical protein
LTSARARDATAVRPSSGQSWNQSMVQQLMSAGNIRSRSRKASPMGLKARTTWRLALERSMKKARCSACGMVAAHL